MESNDIKKTALAFLTENQRLTAALGTSTNDGQSHVSSIFYFVDGDFNFFFLTAANTQKYNNLIANPKASIAIGFGPDYTTIQSQGTTYLLQKSSDEENEAIAQIKKRLQDHEDETWPLFQLDSFAGESIAVFKFVPHSLQILNLEDDNGLVVTTKDIVRII